MATMRSPGPDRCAPVLDVDFLARLEADLGPQTLRRILGLTIDGIRRHLRAMEAAPDDVGVLHAAAHNLITLGGNMGFVALSTIAATVQDAIDHPTGPPLPASVVPASKAALIVAARAALERAEAEVARLAAGDR
jgi:HPt (histidine-containing phosphotransfer) domain-containing protein